MKKTLFRNKIKSAENIMQDEDGKLVRDEKEIASIFNYFFVNNYSPKLRDKY